MLLRADHISKQYDDEMILREVSLEVKPRESLVIIGPSGCGKSTILSILGLLLQPTKGEIIFEDQAVTSLSDDEKSKLRNRSFGFIFQNPQLIGSLSVLDNVLMPASLARKRNQTDKAIEILHDLGLESRLNHYPHQLSIGQKRRAAIARALLLDPAIVFADEPTNDLDPQRAARIGDFLLNLPRKGKALILVTHDTRLAGKANRAVAIADGKIKAIGPQNLDQFTQPADMPAQ
ncbi:MAG TPA: ABC transporter ATP-binding protein [Syntrophomonas sp.]|nr:ABC transporter ATP-binding protein [Syntrophomonas sp.]